MCSLHGFKCMMVGAILGGNLDLEISLQRSRARHHELETMLATLEAEEANEMDPRHVQLHLMRCRGSTNQAEDAGEAEQPPDVKPWIGVTEESEAAALATALEASVGDFVRQVDRKWQAIARAEEEQLMQALHEGVIYVGLQLSYSRPAPALYRPYSDPRP